MNEYYKQVVIIGAFFFLGALLCTVHARQVKAGLQTLKRRMAHTLIVSSKSFKDGQIMPKKYTCAGDNTSPHIFWSNVPEATKTFVLICDDPDAPTQDPWVHWIVFNIPATQNELEENYLSENSELCQGLNSFNKQEYGGPCPPIGHGMHHYAFKVYALDTKLELESGATKNDLESAMIGHILATGELIGKFMRE